MITHDSVLSRLRKAVKKVKFLLNFNLNRLRVATMIRGASSGKRRLSFNDRPGLRACTDDYTRGSPDSASISSHRGIHRTISYPCEEDDIDKRAEMFIANFHKQLQIERQISLELSYCRENSFDYVSP